MKRSALVRLVFVCLVVTAIRNAGAGSAVATDGHGHTVHSFGHAKTVAIQRALETARLYGWTDARIVAATDITGYGAIAVCSRGKNRSALGVALGKASRAEAEKRAIEVCLKGGGTHPVVRWEWHG
jgi:hypothetical protein